MSEDLGALGRKTGVVVCELLHGGEDGQGDSEWSLGEELASPKTPSSILLVVPSTAILDKNRATIYGSQGFTERYCVRVLSPTARAPVTVTSNETKARARTPSLRAIVLAVRCSHRSPMTNFMQVVGSLAGCLFPCGFTFWKKQLPVYVVDDAFSIDS